MRILLLNRGENVVATGGEMLFRMTMFLTLTLIQMPPKQTTFENNLAKEEIAHDEQFLLFPQFFQLLVIDYPFNYKFSIFGQKLSAQTTFMLERVVKKRLLYIWPRFHQRFLNLKT